MRFKRLELSAVGPPSYFEAFLRAGSAGGYVQNVLRPYVAARGWSRPAYAWPW